MHNFHLRKRKPNQDRNLSYAEENEKTLNWRSKNVNNRGKKFFLLCTIKSEIIFRKCVYKLTFGKKTAKHHHINLGSKGLFLIHIYKYPWIFLLFFLTNFLSIKFSFNICSIQASPNLRKRTFIYICNHWY